MMTTLKLYAGDDRDLTLLHEIALPETGAAAPTLLVDQMGRYWCWFETNLQEEGGTITVDEALYVLAEPAAIKIVGL